MRLHLCETLFIKESSLHRIYEMARASSIGALLAESALEVELYEQLTCVRTTLPDTAKTLRFQCLRIQTGPDARGKNA